MIHYHGGPLCTDAVALRAWRGGHAFVSHAKPDQIALAAEVTQSFALDNGAFTRWKRGTSSAGWSDYYEWVDEWRRHPGCDFAVIPDVIGGGEEENDALLSEWPHGRWLGAPVWHTDESVERLARLCGSYPRVCLGSSGRYDVSKPAQFLARAHEALAAVCDSRGRPPCKLHGLRMLNPIVFTQMPLSSADSTNVSRNIIADSSWVGTYRPASKETRAVILRERVESFNSLPALPVSPPTESERRAAAVLVRTKF